MPELLFNPPLVDALLKRVLKADNCPDEDEAPKRELREDDSSDELPKREFK